MDGLLVCAARCLASAALCRYSSDRDDMLGEHWKDDSVPQIHRTLRQGRRWSVGHLRLPLGADDKSRPALRLTTGRVGATWMVPRVSRCTNARVISSMRLHTR